MEIIDTYIIKIRILNSKCKIFIDKNEAYSYITSAFLEEYWSDLKSHLIVDKVAYIKDLPLSFKNIKIYSSLAIIREKISMMILGKDWLKDKQVYHSKENNAFII